MVPLKQQQEELNLKWMAEKGGVGRIKVVKEIIAKTRLDIEKCEREFDLNKAAELKYSTLPALEKELVALEEASERVSASGEERMLRDEVVADDIAAVVAVWTGIPPQYAIVCNALGRGRCASKAAGGAQSGLNRRSPSLREGSLRCSV